jgi:peptide/nickel transport system substrate-binding protein
MNANDPCRKLVLALMILLASFMMLDAGTIQAKESTITVIQGMDPVTLDPQFEESSPLSNILYLVFDRIVALDRDVNVKPMIAESFGPLEDKKTWRIVLKKGIKFWNGEPLNAHAVKFTIDRMGDENLRKQGLNDPFPARAGLDHVKIIDDYTVDIVLKKPNIMFPLFLQFVHVLEPNYYSTHTVQETAIKPMGSGPWIFKEWIKDDHLTVVANPDYWRGKPPIDTVIYRPVPEKSTRLAMLESGDADIVADIGPEDLPMIQKNPKLRFAKAGGRRYAIHIPCRIDRYKDRRVRQALNHAVDFASINKFILSNLADKQLAVPVLGKYWTNPDIKPYKYNPEKAKKLLAEAKFPMDEEISIYTPSGRYVKDVEVAEAVAGFLRDIGLKAFAKTLEWTVFTQKIRSRTLDDLYLIALGSRFNGPQDLNIVMPKQAWDVTDWAENSENGPAFVKLYSELETTFDLKKQQAIVWEMSRLWAEEAPWIPLWDMQTLYGVNKRINWESSGNYRIELWIVDEDCVRIIE